MTWGARLKVGAVSLIAAVLAGALVWQVWSVDDEEHAEKNVHTGLGLWNCPIDPNEVIARAPSLRQLKVEILEWDKIAPATRVEVRKRDGASLVLLVRGPDYGPHSVRARQTEGGAWISTPGAGCG